jgi:DNA-directed RNA polymerase subunit H (RpoH/RPB5)
MSKDEIKDLFQFTASERADLPKIFITDTQIIWLGAKIGDVIEVTRGSEATGYAIIHRVVTHPM